MYTRASRVPALCMLLVLLVASAGCSVVQITSQNGRGSTAGAPTRPPASTPLPTVSAGLEIPPLEDFTGLVSRLLAAGVTVEQGGPTERSILSGVGRTLRVNGADVQVFEYADEASARTDANRFSPDGSTYNGSLVGWNGSPHVYQRARLLVLYAGSEIGVINPLEFVLGRQIAGAALPGSGGPVVAGITPAPIASSVPVTPTRATPAGPACKNRALMIADVTVPDNLRIPPGQSFLKTWRLRNTGTCTWTDTYALVFASGSALDGAPAVPFSKTVAAGATIDVSVTLTAPVKAGTYRSNWRLRDANGTVFGIDNSRDGVFWAQIVVGTSGGERITIPARKTTASLKTNLTAGVPRGYLVNVQAGQQVTVTATGKTELVVLDPTGKTVPATTVTPDQAQWTVTILATGDHTLVFRGSGLTTVTVTVASPVASTTAQSPPSAGRVAFPRITIPPGATSVTLRTQAANDAPTGYVLSAAADQHLRLWLSSPGTSVEVSGPNGRQVAPAAASSDGRQTEYVLATTGEYTLAFRGSPNTITVEIPAS